MARHSSIAERTPRRGLVPVAALLRAAHVKGTSMSKASRQHEAGDSAKAAGRPSKVGILVTSLRQPNGATVAELASAMGWQNHSVRGALAGTLRKKGHAVHSDVVNGLRRYRIMGPIV